MGNHPHRGMSGPFAEHRSAGIAVMRQIALTDRCNLGMRIMRRCREAIG